MSLQQVLDELVKRRLERCKTDLAYFIRSYVRIEDQDAATQGSSIIAPFDLWPAQEAALRAINDNRLIVFLKARQMGFTWLGLGYSTHEMLFQPGYTVTALSKREDDAKELVRRMRFVLENLPPWMIRPADKELNKGYTGPTWEDTATKIVIHHPNDQPSIFTALPAAPESGRSLTGNCILIDEWAFQQFADPIWDSVYPTVNRPTGGKVIGISTAKRNTLFEKMWERSNQLVWDGKTLEPRKPGDSNFTGVFFPWWCDPRRDDTWYQATKTEMPNTYKSEYPSTPEEAFSVGVGAFFQEWDEDVHYVGVWEPPKHWRMYAAYDPGFASFACFKAYAVSPEGWAVCCRELYMHRKIDSEQAQIILDACRYDDGQPFVFEDIPADTDAWTKSRDTGKSTAEVFADNGIFMRQADKDLRNGWMRLHEWLRPIDGPDGQKTAMLRFNHLCPNSRRTYPACEQSQTNPEDISSKSEHHTQDVDRYFVMSRPLPTMIPAPAKAKSLDNQAWTHLEKLVNRRNGTYDETLGEDW